MLSLTRKRPLSCWNQGCLKGKGSTLNREVPLSQKKIILLGEDAFSGRAIDFGCGLPC